MKVNIGFWINSTTWSQVSQHVKFSYLTHITTIISLVFPFQKSNQGLKQVISHINVANIK